MPICPTCHATIHPGAEDQCPACGYSLRRANDIFGYRDVDFTRVLDEAGALTHHDRMELIRTLEDLERNISPIALCIYITSDGRVQDFRPHAHWILNHAHIHHPSFGRREKNQAIEDAGLREAEPGEERQRAAAAPPTWWQRVRAYMRDVMHPYPPPVRREWMLILVMDVQLEVACFSWGYMLDPYINPDSINSCIYKARLQFRERDMVGGLKKVMRAAVSQIASQSHRVNRNMRRSAQSIALLLAGSAALLSSPLQAQTQLPTPWADEEAAEEVDEEAPAAPAPAPPPPAAQVTDGGAAASQASPPRWSAEDYRHLLSGELPGAYTLLRAPASAAPARPVSGTSARQTPESDTKVPKLYYAEYGVATKSGVIDPQRLLTNVQREDIEYALRTLNAHAPYHLYLAVFKQGQELPLELAVGALVRTVAQPGEYAAMIMYGLGDTPQVELGYHEIQLSDEDRLAWLERVRAAAQARGGIEGVLAAVQELHTCLGPVAEQLPPLTQQTSVHVPLIPIEKQVDDLPDEPTFKDDVYRFLQSPATRTIALWVLGVLAFLGLVGVVIWVRRRSGKLYKTEHPDVRLASPYGAGVSRNVRYLKGKDM